MTLVSKVVKVNSPSDQHVSRRPLESEDSVCRLLGRTVATLVSLAVGRLNYTAALPAKGPVTSEVLDLIRGKRKSNRWSQFLATDGHDLVPKREWTNSRLCKVYEQLLRKQWDVHQIDPLAYPSDLVEFSHTR